MKQYALAALFGLTSTIANAATFDLFQSSHSNSFTMGLFETRETVVNVNSAIRLTELGAEIKPIGDASYRWNIFTSDLSASEISQVFTLDFSVEDVGWDVYDTAVNVSLGIGTYIIQLENLGATSYMRRYNEVNEILPFGLAGGAITVLDGSVNNWERSSILPSISISIESALRSAQLTPPPVSTVPLPASFLLLGGSLFGFIGLRRRKRTR